MVAAVEEDRRSGGEQRSRGIDIVRKKLFFALDAARHVAVEDDESQFTEIYLLTKLRHVVGTAVDVVEDDERTIGARVGESPERIGFAAENVARGDTPVGGFAALRPRRDLLRKDAVTVIRAGFQPLDAHGMKGSVGQLAARDGLVVARMLLRVETPPVVGRDLDPRKGRFAGGPDDRDAVLGHVAEIGAVRDLEILCRGSQRKEQPGKRKKEFFHCRKVLVVPECKIRKIPQNPAPVVRSPAAVMQQRPAAFGRRHNYLRAVFFLRTDQPKCPSASPSAKYSPWE